MEEVLAALNSLVAEGVIVTYAIGGAIGASFYVEALQTEGVDAFVYTPETSGGLLLLDSIYEALKRRGGIVEGAHVRFGAWPLQVLPDSNELVREAIRDAVTVPFGQIGIRVFRAEHLFAIALQTGRAKDYLRAEVLLTSGVVSLSGVGKILERFGLLDRLAKLRKQDFPND